MNLSIAALESHRDACVAHALRRARERGIRLSRRDADSLARTCEVLRPAFEIPGRTRFWVTVRRQRLKFRALYDTRLGCLVTVRA